MAVVAAWLPYLAAAALMLALAAWLLWLDAADRIHRTFSAVLLFRALTMAVAGVRGTVADPALSELLLRLLPYLILPLVPLAAYFASVYPRPRGWLGRSRAGPWVALLAAVALDAAYLVDHATVWTYAPAEGDTGLAAAGGGLAFTGFGPLALFLGLQPVVFAALALLFARDALRSGGSRRKSALLVSAGFLLNALFDGVLQSLSLVGSLLSGDGVPHPPWGLALVGLPPLALVPAALALVLLAHGARRGDASLRAGALRVLVVAPAPVVSALLVARAAPGADDLGIPLSGLVLGIWRLALPLLVTYALVRHQLFDIDVKVKAGIRASTVAGAFLLVFFTASEVAANVVQERVGTLLGLASAVALAFALRPLERFAERLAHRVMPGTKPVHALAEDERLAFYREQVALAWEDGNVGEKETRMLLRLRERLGLDPALAEAAEREGRALAAA